MNRLFALFLLISAALPAQTTPPDITGVWLLDEPNWNGGLIIQKRSNYDFYGRLELAGQDPKPVTGTITPGSPNPNVLSLRLEIHTFFADTGVAAILIAEGYTLGPNALVGILPDNRKYPPGTLFLGGWGATRFNPAPTPPPVATPSPESVKLDTLAIAVDRLQTILQSILDQLAALKPQN